jgi:hypothetical protein
VRRYSKWEFVAADDEKALAYLMDCQKAGCIPWEAENETGDAGALDPILMLDRCTGRGERDDVAEEIRLPRHVYFRDVKAFAEKVAKLADEGAYNSVIDMLEGLIEEARALLKGAPEFEA